VFPSSRLDEPSRLWCPLMGVAAHNQGRIAFRNNCLQITIICRLWPQISNFKNLVSGSPRVSRIRVDPRQGGVKAKFSFAEIGTELGTKLVLSEKRLLTSIFGFKFQRRQAPPKPMRTRRRLCEYYVEAISSPSGDSSHRDSSVFATPANLHHMQFR
jgi:hypothetical protein